MNIYKKLASFLASASLFYLGNLPPAQANFFNTQEVQQERFIALASPFGVERRSYQLLILEQVSNTRACWQELGGEPTIVDPSLLSFDFTGICARSTDSNGYSVRIGNQDLGWRYLLTLVPKGNELVLVASSLMRGGGGSIEIGRTKGLAEGYMKIYLDEGWRFTKRTYNGQVLGHVYLTGDPDVVNVSLNELKVDPPSSVPTPTPPNRPGIPNPMNNTPRNNPPTVTPPPPRIPVTPGNSRPRSSNGERGIPTLE